jgi:hypothetical protein
MEFQLDNHSGPVMGGMKLSGHSLSWSAVLERRPDGVCSEFRNGQGAVYPIDRSDPAQLPKKVEDSAGKTAYYIVAPMVKGPITAVQCGGAWIPARAAWMAEERARTLHIRKLAQTERDVPVFRSISSEIGYIRFPSFDPATVDLIGRLEQSLKGHPHNERLLIVDLRANGGGGMRILALREWTALRESAVRRRIGASCLYAALRFGLTQMGAAQQTPPLGPTLKSFFQHGLDSLAGDGAPGCPARYVETPAKWSYTNHRPLASNGKTRLLALVDNYCGSDCELATAAIAAIPGSVIAGVNTVGVAQFVQPGYFILPHTRLPFRIALGTSDNYGDGRSFDGYGYDVDILLTTEQEMSAEGIMRLAERLISQR